VAAKWREFRDFRSELLEDDDFRSEYRALEPEYTVAGQILATRLASGLSQQALAKAIGTSQSRVSSWERGEELPRLDALHRIAIATGSRMHLSIGPEGLADNESDAVVVEINTAARRRGQRKTTRKSTGRKKTAAGGSSSRRKTTARKATGRKKIAAPRSSRRKTTTRKATGRKKTVARSA
jgi:transcriptional regulator with XRE-family HTH domain